MLENGIQDYDCLANALLIPSDLNVNIAFSAVGCRNNIFLVMIHFYIVQ